MPKFKNEPILDYATLARMNEEFAAGKYDDLELPPSEPLDPRTDPFGMNFRWLDPIESTDRFELAFQAVATTHPERRFAKVASELRQVALRGVLAVGTDREVIEKWSRVNFTSRCRAEGESGDELVAWITAETIPTRELIAAVYGFLERQNDFAAWEPEKRLAAAMAIMDSLMGTAPPSTESETEDS